VADRTERRHSDVCTIRSETEAMVCDAARDPVREEMARLLGGAFEAETVHGEGTRFTCVDPNAAPRFQEALERGQRRASGTGIA
jgi:hypothetical protein